VKKLLSGLAFMAVMIFIACSATGPGRVETALATEAKKVTIGGRDWKNPAPDTQASIDEGRGHFQHHCQICHGLDGHNTGVPFAEKMSPPVADLGEKDVQQYSDGQLKWIVENGIRLTGMPGWKGILEDDEMWKIVRFMRRLPAKGSAGIPEVYKEEAEQHEQMKAGEPAKAGAAKPHSHAAGEKPHQH
jgi:S-disulfanyl-L-cysteine oxidoreductase SoxD